MGLGLGFDFSRIEYDFTSRTVKVDGRTPVGWRIHVFDIVLEEGTYKCSVAEKIRTLSGCELTNSDIEVKYLDITRVVRELNDE